jgi:hypothetical protein
LYRYVGGNPFRATDPLGLYLDGTDGCHREAIDAMIDQFRDLREQLRSPNTSDAEKRRLFDELFDLINQLRRFGLGHGDFPFGDRFNWRKEDYGLHAPFPDPWAHFQDLWQSQQQVADAIRRGDLDAFERAVHRGQDYWSHYREGYRAPEGHILAPHSPDDTTRLAPLLGWLQAADWTRDQVQAWNSAWGAKGTVFAPGFGSVPAADGPGAMP